MNYEYKFDCQKHFHHYLFANMLFAFIIIFLSRKNPGTTWAWVLVLMFIPVLGFFVPVSGPGCAPDKNLYRKARQDEKIKENLSSAFPGKY